MFQLTHFCLGETNMKASFLAVSATGAVVLLSAFAGTRTSPKLHPESLARFEAITSYCGGIQPDANERFQLRLARMVSGHSPDELRDDRNTSAYQAAKREANETLARTSHGTAVRACSEFLAAK